MVNRSKHGMKDVLNFRGVRSQLTSVSYSQGGWWEFIQPCFIKVMIPERIVPRVLFIDASLFTGELPGFQSVQ